MPLDRRTPDDLHLVDVDIIRLHALGGGAHERADIGGECAEGMLDEVPVAVGATLGTVELDQQVDPVLHDLGRRRDGVGHVGGHVQVEVQLGLEVVCGRIGHTGLAKDVAQQGGGVGDTAVPVEAGGHALAQGVLHHLVRDGPRELLGLVGKVGAPVATEVGGGGDGLGAVARLGAGGVDAAGEETCEVAAGRLVPFDDLIHGGAAESVLDVLQERLAGVGVGEVLQFLKRSGRVVEGVGHVCTKFQRSGSLWAATTLCGVPCVGSVTESVMRPETNTDDDERHHS